MSGMGRGSSDRPTFLSGRFEAVYEGEEITIWNHLTVTQTHYVTAGQIEREHRISAGDAPGNQRPEYITPEMDEQLRQLDVYPDAEVVDPHDEEVDLL